MPHKDLDHRPVKSTNPSGYQQSKTPDKPAIQGKNDRSRANAVSYFLRSRHALTAAHSRLEKGLMIAGADPSRALDRALIYKALKTSST
ncbi:MAG: hypothetical protein ACR2HL_04905 [Methylocystis sp.]